MSNFKSALNKGINVAGDVLKYAISPASPVDELTKEEVLKMAAASKVRKEVGDKIGEKIESTQTSKEGVGTKFLNALTAPQRHSLAFLAKKMGVEGDVANSETSSQNIVEKVAERLGVPEESVVGNFAKALGVAGLEVFADPLSLVPVGKIAKLTKLGAIAKMAKGAKGAELFAEQAAKMSSKLKTAEELGKEISAARKATGLTPLGEAKNIAEKAGMVKKEASVGKVASEANIPEGQKIIQKTTGAENPWVKAAEAQDKVRHERLMQEATDRFGKELATAQKMGNVTAIENAKAKIANYVRIRKGR